MNKRLSAILEASGMLILISLGTIFTKMVLSDISSFTFAWVMVALGIIFLSIYTFIIRKERIPASLSKEIWLYMIVIGLGNFTITKITRPIMLKNLPVITSTYLGNFVGFVTMFMSIFILKEFPSIFQLLGAGISFYGITIYFNEPLKGGEVIGALMAVVGILVTALTNNLSRKLRLISDNPLSPSLISTLQLIIGGSGVLLAGLIFDFPPKIYGLKNWMILIYIALASMVIYSIVWNNILKVMRSYEASILGSSTIIYTTLLAMLILKERLLLHQWIGMGTMVVGLLLVQERRGNLKELYLKMKKKDKKQINR
jgi:drug/metabolite transporter (DMT)-like permease